MQSLMVVRLAGPPDALPGFRDCPVITQVDLLVFHPSADGHSRSIKMLSSHRPCPSMLIVILSGSSSPVKRSLGNGDP